MDQERDYWYDEAAGPLVRMYGVTRGRTRDVTPELSMITIVVAVPGTPDTRLQRMDPEYQRIVEIAQYPRAIAEISARLHLPVRVIRILIGDLIADGYLSINSNQARHSAPDKSEAAELLRAIRDGLLKL
ncbi:DUF742 domain-containing protein [Nocardia sp. NBC_01503]|uniref:DUF742 domain-containing protein n=1 Tax=Nocardia sp. NBC_01503 TaxID=2975997 RepID=UPI002E7BE261|nr:DUF742 domain-containing protein [Nocardia sp. NBC_01503]WTL29077.1 DUF742 domain-containing protein [Nocardia sp. NBC_01503]